MKEQRFTIAPLKWRRTPNCGGYFAESVFGPYVVSARAGGQWFARTTSGYYGYKSLKLAKAAVWSSHCAKMMQGLCLVK